MKQFNISLPEVLKSKLKKESEQTGQPIAALIRQAIIEYFERKS